MKLKENWWRFNRGATLQFLREGHEGKQHPSRLKLISLLDGMTTVLDAGCGTGVMFEVLREARPDLDYTGVDVTEHFICTAQQMYPDDAARFRCHSVFEPLDRNYDAVFCRHLLEHLPDFAPAVEKLYTAARKKLLVVFYLPPIPLRWGRRKHNEKYTRDFYYHTYDLGIFVKYLHDLQPTPQEIRIHPHVGTSDPGQPWGHRPNSIYEVIR